MLNNMQLILRWNPLKIDIYFPNFLQYDENGETKNNREEWYDGQARQNFMVYRKDTLSLYADLSKIIDDIIENSEKIF